MNGPTVLSRLFTRVVIAVGLVAALWFGIHLAAQQPGGPPRNADASGPWRGAPTTGDLRPAPRPR